MAEDHDAAISSVEIAVLLDEAFAVAPAVVPLDIAKFSRHIDPDWIEDALAATGTATVRRRRLPAEMVIWLVIGMALMRNESIRRVSDLLSLVLPSTKKPLVAPSALTQARQRLGDEPLEYLFTVSATEWTARSADEHRWRGLALYALDGTTMRVPDSEQNWKEFGGQKGSGRRGGSAYPTVRAVALMAVRARLIAAIRFGPYSKGETTLAGPLWDEIPDNSLTIGDRGFLISGTLHRLASTGANRQWLVRAKKTFKLRTIKTFGPNDRLVEVMLSPQTRKAHPELPPEWRVRAVRYQRRGFRPVLLLSSLLDARKYPAREIAELYHERWEIELGYGEIKTQLLAREEAIRSRTVAGVRQELWAIALAYNLVRTEMERAAIAAAVEPKRISFVNALSLIRAAWLSWSTPPLAPGRIPEGILDLRRHLGLLLLPERRPERVYPRAVKIKMSNYLRQRPRHRPN